MFFERDTGTQQLDNLRLLYAEANTGLQTLNRNYPGEKKTWDIVRKKMDIIKETLDKNELPTDDRKRDADISTMLNFELRDFPADKNFNALFKLDRAFTLLGMKNILFKDTP